jgi:hypothetical protein
VPGLMKSQRPKNVSTAMLISRTTVATLGMRRAAEASTACRADERVFNRKRAPSQGRARNSEHGSRKRRDPPCSQRCLEIARLPSCSPALPEFF